MQSVVIYRVCSVWCKVKFIHRICRKRLQTITKISHGLSKVTLNRSPSRKVKTRVLYIPVTTVETDYSVKTMAKLQRLSVNLID